MSTKQTPLEDELRVLLMNHSDLVYAYYKSDGKENWNDTEFIDRIITLITKRENALLERVETWAKEHNNDADLVSTFDLIRYIEALRKEKA